MSHENITKKLISLLNVHPEIRNLLKLSIKIAKEENPDPKTNPAQNLGQYFSYIDWAAKALPWNVLREIEAGSIYAKIDQGLDYLYFINDRPLEKLENHGYYHNSIQYLYPYSQWLNDFVKNWGIFLSTKQSWNDEYYKIVYADEKFGLQTDQYESQKNWHTFNDFFARKLSSPSKRPIAYPNDDKIVCSPADSVVQGIWKIDDKSHIIQNTEDFEVKSRKFLSIKELLGDRSNYSESFKNGVLMHSFLDVHDYHRYHFPVSGKVIELNIIPQNCHSGGILSYDKTDRRYKLDAKSVGWQMIETRGVAIIETENHGKVAVLPVGMSQVSSVNFREDIKVGDMVKKGDELGYFLFGGSDIVMVFEEKAMFNLTVLNKNGEYQHINACSIVGTMP